MYEKIHLVFALKPEQRGFLGVNFETFLTWMQKHNYSWSSMHNNIQYVIYYETYLYRRGIRSMRQIDGIAGQKLLEDFKRYRRRHRYWQRDFAIPLYFHALKGGDAIRRVPSQNIILFPWTQRYANFLRNQRGLKERSIKIYTKCVDKFLYFIGCRKDKSSMPAFKITDVDQFMQLKLAHLARKTKSTHAGILRSFVQFMYQSGELPQDISHLILAPKIYKLESLPYVLKWDEVKKILDGVDRSTKKGLRGYAILMLLATNGVRAEEVARLRFEDIDWRKETIHITRRKAGQDLLLPLMPQVGKALIDYLKRGRPVTSYREIFVLDRAPWTPVSRSLVSLVAKRYIQLAGLNFPRCGSHLFRYTFATHLNNRGVPPKQIGDLLGQSDPDSVRIYTKTATDKLKGIALEVPKVKL